MRKAVALALTVATLTAGLLTGQGVASASTAGEPDLHAGACELSWAFHSGQRVYEDLAFADATPAYETARPVLADLFWETQPAGADWPTEAGEDLEDWLDDQITRPCSDLDSGA